MNDLEPVVSRNNFMSKFRLLWAVADWAVMLAGMCAIFGFAARLSWAADMCCHLRVQLLIFLLPATLVYWIFRRGAIAWWVLACLIANAVPMPPYLWPAAAPLATAKGDVARIMLLNVLISNPNKKGVVEYVQRLAPDIFIALETDHEWTTGLEPLHKMFPHRYLINDRGSSSLAAYSPIPFDSIETLPSTKRRVPSIDMTVTLDGKPLQIVATHPCPPKTKEKAGLRNEQMKNIAAAMDQTRSRMLIGDFNCVPWSPHFTDMLTTASVRPAGYGHGLSPTWYTLSRRYGPLTGTWLFGMKLDHVLVGPDVVASRYRIGPSLGSDHMPIIVDFRLDD